MRKLHNLSSNSAEFHYPFDKERHPFGRDAFKDRRSTAFGNRAQWPQVGVGRTVPEGRLSVQFYSGSPRARFVENFDM